jgi:hypothetical protein
MASPAESQDLEVLIMRSVLVSLAVTLTAAAPQARAARPASQREPPVARVTGDKALVKENGRFDQTWVHPDADITRDSKLYVWDVVFQFRDVGKAKNRGTTRSILRSTGREVYPLPRESQEKFKHVVVEAFVRELQRSESFQVVDEVGPGTLLVRGAVLDIVSWVPPSRSRVDSYMSAVGEGIVIFELIDAETGLMQARLGERQYIRPPEQRYNAFSRPVNLNTVWPDVNRWARAVAANLRRELEDRQKKREEEDR